MNDIRNPALHTAGLAAAEGAANYSLGLSPHTQQELRAIAGQVIAVQCTKPPLTVYVSSDEDGALQLRGVYEGAVATRIIGETGDFLELARSEDPAATLINGNIQLEGSSSTLLDMQRVLTQIDIDWEAPLVQGLGDVVGHQVADVLRGLFSWSRDSGNRLQRQLREFALEEARLSPTRLELEDFYADTQALGERSERLEQRVEQLRQRLERLRDV